MSEEEKTPDEFDDALAYEQAHTPEWQEIERPWLPDKFKTPEALVESYNQAQQRITELGTERSALRDELEQLKAVTTTAVNMGQDFAQNEDALRTQDPREILTQVAALAREKTDRSMAPLVPQVPADVAMAVEEGTTQIAVEYVAKQLGDRWESLAPEVYDFLSTNPEMSSHLQVAVSSGDPNAIASTLLGAVNVIEQGRTAKAREDYKRSVMTLPGAAGRPPTPDPAEAEWSQVQQAARKEPGQYW